MGRLSGDNTVWGGNVYPKLLFSLVIVTVGLYAYRYRDISNIRPSCPPARQMRQPVLDTFQLFQKALQLFRGQISLGPGQDLIQRHA